MVSQYDKLKTNAFLEVLDSDDNKNVTESIGAFLITTPPEELASTDFNRISFLSNEQYGEIK